MKNKRGQYVLFSLLIGFIVGCGYIGIRELLKKEINFEWIIYKNEEAGYEIGYPNTWKIEEGEKFDQVGFVNRVVFRSPDYSEKTGAAIFIDVFEGAEKNKPLFGWLRGYMDASSPDETKEIEIGGLKATQEIERSSVGSFDNLSEILSIRTLIITSNQMVYRINMLASTEKNLDIKYIIINDEILRRFKIK